MGIMAQGITSLGFSPSEPGQHKMLSSLPKLISVLATATVLEKSTWRLQEPGAHYVDKVRITCFAARHGFTMMSRPASHTYT